MSGSLYVLDGDVVRAEPDAFAWAEFMENADRVIELSEGFTPTSRWQLVTFFMGIAKAGVFGEPFFFATQLAEGLTTDTMEVRQEPLMSRDKAEALINHAFMLDELRPLTRPPRLA